ncbi:cutinase precursor [Venturia nashicola]|uniref:Cutinase n=1 Tax=Venturia nashicola TaxID=86259 RepID=A0A4Z1PBQ4_9PEZI|nr:cutinase precursor [Venturia nashicola]TLD37911.1 cutinase precursor [Venturia nashicola]
MRYSSTFFFASLVASMPNLVTLKSRQIMQEVTDGACKDVTFVWVRGTTETANIGSIVGAGLITAMKSKFPSLAVEGVTYNAGVMTNMRSDGADPVGVTNAKKIYEMAASKCPDTTIIGGGYSQGAAIQHKAVESLADDIKSRITAVLLFGDTKFTADGGKIKGFPPERVRTFCNGFGDLKSVTPIDTICESHAIPQLALTSTGGHLSYSSSYTPGAEWLAEKVAAAKGKPA